MHASSSVERYFALFFGDVYNGNITNRTCQLRHYRTKHYCDNATHMNMAYILLLLAIGFVSGIAAGLFGIGGGVLIIPALIYLAGFSQHAATGTSLAILLPPVGLAAVIEYYRHGNVDLKSALIVAFALFIGGWFGALVANRIAGPYLELGFGLFVISLGLYILFEAAHKVF